MFTKWAKEAMRYNISSDAVLPSVGVTYGPIAAKHYDGTTIYIGPGRYGANPFQTFIASGAGTETAGVIVGTGTTAATDEDYALATPITSGISGTVATSTAIDSTTKKFYNYMTVTLTNSTAADIVVNEIGYYAVFGTATEQGGSISTGGGRRKSALIDRTVLETPVTVPANGSAVIRYEIQY